MWTLDNQKRRCSFNYSESQGNFNALIYEVIITSQHLKFQIIVAFFKNKKGQRGIVLDPLVIKKQFKSYGERYKTKYLRFDGGSIRDHSAYKNFDTNGPINENEKPLEETYIELHEDNKNALVQVKINWAFITDSRLFKSLIGISYIQQDHLTRR